MLIRNTNSEIGEFLAYNLSTTNELFILVKLANGYLAEWRIQNCCIIESKDETDKCKACKKAMSDAEFEHRQACDLDP